AQTKATILLTGENGTGKSTLVHYIHHKYNQGSNNDQLNSSGLVSVNMGAIPGDLFESEMFGHTKGAFTGAHQTRIGRFELAESGTLFLDEVANIPLASQAKLLRVLESGEYEPVGSSITQKANVRLISATNADFKHLFKQGLFRQDLYFRLNTIEFTIPALRERLEDIPELAEIMLTKLCLQYDKSLMSLLPCAIKRLCRYDFPGNLRELSHILERVVLMHKEVAIKAESLMINDNYQQAVMNKESTTTQALNQEQSIPLMTIEAAERLLIDQALSQCHGQTHEAAALLGLSKSAIYRRLEKYKISAKDYLKVVS
ncbi:MAG: sigma-54 dependent transcriptional regulator, partial [Colwellia sp.]|nr:sigma-54 dependent transcriptional regulator [Colwellia sp.]